MVLKVNGLNHKAINKLYHRQKWLYYAKLLSLPKWKNNIQMCSRMADIYANDVVINHTMLPNEIKKEILLNLNIMYNNDFD